MAQPGTSPLIDEVTAIWQHVLHRPTIGVRENFFELGGGPREATELSCEIECRLGRHMPPLTVYHTPTIASLSEALEESSFPKIPPLTLLRAGSGRAPLYIAHGIGGTVLEFFDLVKHIGPDRSVYGMQAKGSDGVSEPFDRIEDMANFHLEAIRQIQPHGPYFLVGHSLGGLVTVEMARAILKSGENPGVVVMIDSYPHVKCLARRQQMRLIARLAARRVFGAKKPANSLGSKGLEGPAATKAAMRRVRERGYVALERYRPGFYDGKIHFIRAEKVSVFPDDPEAVWSQFAKEFELETVPGDHFGTLTAHAKTLARILSRYARQLDD